MSERTPTTLEEITDIIMVEGSGEEGEKRSLRAMTLTTATGAGQDSSILSVAEALKKYPERRAEIETSIKAARRLIQDVSGAPTPEPPPVVTGAEKPAFTTAPNSPLPALNLPPFDPAKHNHDILSDKPKGVRWVAVLDCDKTLLRSKSSHTILLHDFAKYLLKNHQDKFTGAPRERNLKALNGLIKYCDDWEKQRKDVSNGLPTDKEIPYEEGITKSGEMSAAAFEGFSLEELKNWGADFVRQHLSGEVFDYVPDTLDKLRDHGILPVMVTGAPDFLVPFLLEKLGMTHGNGMTYAVGEDGKLSGTIQTNMGLAAKKASHCTKLTDGGLAIVLAIGDSPGDSGLFEAALSASGGRQDVPGVGIVVNAPDATVAEMARHHSEAAAQDRFEILGEKDSPSTGKKSTKNAVLTAVDTVLKSLLAPMDDYLGKSVHSQRLETFLESLPKERRYPYYLETLKKIRDILRAEGLQEEEIGSILEKFYPKFMVEKVMKANLIDPKDPGALKAYLEQIGVSRDAIADVLEKSTAYNQPRKG